MQWTVRRLKDGDIEYIAPRLREADKAEIKAASGKEPLECLEDAKSHPNLGIWVSLYDGNPEMIFGVTNGLGEGVGHPWMLCTDKMAEDPRGFLRICRPWVQGFSRNYPVLVNYVHAKNSLHIRWLKWCGFEFTKLHENYAGSNESFWEFQMIRK